LANLDLGQLPDFSLGEVISNSIINTRKKLYGNFIKGSSFLGFGPGLLFQIGRWAGFFGQKSRCQVLNSSAT
jgi:hypothetical protein